MRKTTELDRDLLERKTLAESFLDYSQEMTTFETPAEAGAVGPLSRLRNVMFKH